MTGTHDHDPAEPAGAAAEVRSVFDLLVADEPPLALDLHAPVGLVAAARRRAQRRRTTVAAGVAACAGIAATLLVAGPGLPAAQHRVDLPVPPAGSPAPAVPDLHLTDAGERRIAQEMVGRLQEVYPGSEVDWVRVPPARRSEEPTGLTEPQASLRFTVSGQQGYLLLASYWTLSGEDRADYCDSWRTCLSTSRSSHTMLDEWVPPGPRNPDHQGAITVGRTDGSYVRATGTLSVLAAHDTARALVGGDALRLRAGDLDSPWPRNDLRPGDATMVADLTRVRTLAATWAADLGTPTAQLEMHGEVGPTARPYPRGRLVLGERPDPGTIQVEFGLLRESATEPPTCEVPQDPTCRVLTVDDGRVVFTGTDDGGLEATYVRDDDVSVRWLVTAPLPQGWSADRLAAYVGDIGVFIEPR